MNAEHVSVDDRRPQTSIPVIPSPHGSLVCPSLIPSQPVSHMLRFLKSRAPWLTARYVFFNNLPLRVRWLRGKKVRVGGAIDFREPSEMFGDKYLGCRMPRKDEEEIMKLAGQSLPNMEIWKAIEGKRTYKIEFKRLSKNHVTSR